MGKEESQQRFAEAKKLYAEGKYEEALKRLNYLDKHHPDVFNIQLPIVHCYQHLGRIEDVKKMHAQMVELFKDEKQQKKLARVERWVKRTEDKFRQSDGISKDSQIDSDFEEKMEGGISGLSDSDVKDSSESGSGKNGDTPVEQPDKSARPDDSSKEESVHKHSSVLRKILIAMEVLFILCVGSGVMYLLSAKTTRKLPEFTAKIVMKLNDSEIEGKLFLKDADTFRMEIMEQVFISNDGQVRKLLVEDEQYINVNLADVERYNPLVGLSNFGKWVELNKAKKVGREKLEGFDCDIYEANVPGENNSPSMSTRVWYCRQIKFPLKSENRTESDDPKLQGSVAVALSDLQMEQALPDKMFVLPENYAEFVKKKIDKNDPEKLESLPDNMQKMLEFGDPTALLEQFQ